MNQIEITEKQKREMAEFYKSEVSLSLLTFVCLSFFLLAILYASTLKLQASSIFIYVLFRVFYATIIFAAVVLVKIVMSTIDYAIVHFNRFKVVKTRKRMNFRNIKKSKINLNQEEYAIYARIGVGKYFLCTQKLQESL